MHEVIENFNKEIDEHQQEIYKLRAAIKVFQDTCTHEWQNADEQFDFYHRDEYVRCTRCGIIK